MNRKKVKTMLAVLCCGVVLCSCSQTATKESTTVTEMDMVQETQVYDAGNLFSITLLPQMEQMDMPVLQNQFVMSLFDGKEKYKNLQVIAIGMKKSSLQAYKAEDVSSLEGFAEFVDDYLSGNNMTLSWDGSAEEQMEGMLRCITKEGKISQTNASTNSVAKYAETETMYFAMILTGKKEQLDQAKAVVAVHELENGIGKEQSTLDYFYAMTAVLDRVNGANIMGTMKQVYDLMDTSSEGSNNEEMKKEYEQSVETLQNQSQKNLKDSWEITDKTSLEEMKKWLIEEGHNKEALEMLIEYGVDQDMSREALEEKMNQDGLNDAEKIYTLAVYDARATYGDAALKAWDLSRVPTILEMGYAAGYCTYEETLDGILEVALLTQQTFDSWESFNQSYLYGYSYWAEESLEDSSSSAYERRESVKAMEEEAGGPFTVNWNLELTKEW